MLGPSGVSIGQKDASRPVMRRMHRRSDATSKPGALRAFFLVFFRPPGPSAEEAGALFDGVISDSDGLVHEYCASCDGAEENSRTRRAPLGVDQVLRHHGVESDTGK